MEYDGNKPVRIHTVLIAAQHSPEVDPKQMRDEIIERVILPILPSELVNDKIKYYVNPTGRFVIGGPQGDTGVTGRKIIVDTYGGMRRHGGGAFSGKDPTKVDRSGVHGPIRCQKYRRRRTGRTSARCSLAYAIGMAKPLSIMVNTFGTGKLEDRRSSELINENFDLRPGYIIKNLNLRRPIYRQVAAYGHFGRPELNLPWEKTDKADALKKALAKK